MLGVGFGGEVSAQAHGDRAGSDFGESAGMSAPVGVGGSAQVGAGGASAGGAGDTQGAGGSSESSDAGRGSIDAARSVDALSPETWSRVSGRCSVYSSAPWLRHLEWREDATVSYLLARVGGETAAVLPTYLFTGAVSNPFYDPEVLFARTAQASRARPLLLGGTREGYTTEVMLDNTRPAGPPDDAVAGALR